MVAESPQMDSKHLFVSQYQKNIKRKDRNANSFCVGMLNMNSDICLNTSEYMSR